MPDPQDPATFDASKLDRAASGPSNVAIRAWLREVMAARPLTLLPDAWVRHPVSVSERGATAGDDERTGDRARQPVAASR